MNKFISTLVYVILSIFLLSSCNSKKVTLESVPENKLDKTYTIKLNDTIEIQMASNPTTGYKWDIASKIKPNIIKEIENKYIENNKSSNMLGEGGTQVYKFLAKKEGTLYMNYKYSREDGNLGKEKYFKIVVTK